MDQLVGTQLGLEACVVVEFDIERELRQGDCVASQAPHGDSDRAEFDTAR